MDLKDDNCSTKQLINSTLIYSIGNLGTKILVFALLPIYSFYLSKEDMGVYDLILITINLAIPIISFQISDAAYRWLISSGEDQKSKYEAITNSITITVIFVFCSFLIILLASLFIRIPHLELFLITLLPSCLFPFFQQIARGLKNNKLYAKAGVLNAFLVLALSILFLPILDWSLKGVFLSIALAHIAGIIYIIKKASVLSYFKKELISGSEIKSMVKYSWPLIPNAISWWLINASNKFAILFFLNTEANGVYAISSRVPSIIAIINSIFMLSWQDHLLQDRSDGSKAQSKLFNVFFKLELSIILILIPIAQFMVSAFFDAQYLDSWKYMSILFIASGFSGFSTYYGTYYLKDKKTDSIFYTTLIGGVINLIFTIALINTIGLYAPAVGTLLGFIIVFIIRARFINQKHSLLVEIAPFSFLFISTLVFFYLTLLEISILNICLLFASLIITYYFNKSLFKSFLISLKAIAKQLGI